MRVRRAEEGDEDAILALFAANSRERVRPGERARSGFVQGSMTRGVLRAMREDTGVFVAERDGAVAGFACTSAPESGTGPPPVREIVRRAAAELAFGGRPLDGWAWCFYGPAVVAREHRRQGVLGRLLEGVREGLADRYEVLVAFVEDANEASLAAHRRGLGMERIGGFTVDDRPYSVLALAV